MEIFLTIIIGIIIFLTIIVLIIRKKIKNILSKFGYNSLNLLKDGIKKGELEYKNTPKHVTGMTKLLIPKIVKDFPNFSETELYNKVETSLLLIFNSLENKQVEVNEELILLKDKLNEQIKDMRKDKISVKYDEIRFHRHALKYYKNEDGVLNISVSTSLEYFYKKEYQGKVLDNYTDYKKQTLYTTEFIYVYNPEKISKNQSLIGINCPNCGAPIKDLGKKFCRYCNSGLEDINLKSWHISLYKEEYK